jgi:hypothetical protein
MLEAAPPPPPPVTRSITAPALGVAVGAAATSIDQAALAPGTSGTLTIRGTGLTPVTAVTIAPADGVTLGPPQPIADGTEVHVAFTVAAGQPSGLREVVLATPTGRVPFARPSAALLWIRSAPIIDSITPIVVCADTARVSLAVRGRNLQGALAVTATPPDGIVVGSTITLTIEGQQGLTTDVATVDLAIAADAPLGGHVIRVVVPGFVSTDQADPANTLTVNERPRPDTAGVCPGVAGAGG